VRNNEWRDPEFEPLGRVFAQGAALDEALPGPVLAAAVGSMAAGDVSGLGDDELLGIVSAAKRAAAWMAWAQTVAEAEYATRNSEWDPCAQREVISEFAQHDLAQEIHLSSGAARGRLERSLAAATRLPRSLGLLRAGKIDEFGMKIIAETTATVADVVIGKADRMISEQAPGRTPGSLRKLCQKIVMLLDPDAAEENRKEATKNRRVEVAQEYSGNGMVSVREINPVDALTIKVTVDRWARIMREAGLAGSLDTLRADAATALLTQRHPVTGAYQPAGTGGPWAGTAPADLTPTDDQEENSYSPWEFRSDEGSASVPLTLDPGAVGPAAVINILVPESLLDGTSGAPAQIAGFGDIGGDAARDLVAAASRNQRTRWCVTKVGRGGVAIAHACVPGPHRWDAPETGPPGTGPPVRISEFVRALKPRFETIARHPGDDGHREPRHDPSRKLTHLIQSRNATCAAPGCGAAAVTADMEHRIPWEKGGHTDEHNLDPQCRQHHRLKQRDDWRVIKPAPGITQWTGPSGRTRTIEATRYLV
jgi:hypothetical protein